MPIFEYRCNDCQSSYDILHKGAENVDIIECPACHSRSYVKKFSTFSAAPNGTSSSFDAGCASGSCGVPSYSGGCASGMCGLG
ncbi:MAG TPA: zinc ribbon domain-containing protein [Bacteroidota bacterium]|nr:zinc ribbon domain-containing protein [Bacteroidota bacterium]